MALGRLIFLISAAALGAASAYAEPDLPAGPARPSQVQIKLPPSGPQSALISVPGRKPVYLVSLAPSYDASHHLTRVGLVMTRAGEKDGHNLLQISDKARGADSVEFRAADFSPGLHKPSIATRRIITVRKIRMKLTVDVANVAVRSVPAPKGAPASYEFQALDLRLDAGDTGRR